MDRSLKPPHDLMEELTMLGNRAACIEAVAIEQAMLPVASGAADDLPRGAVTRRRSEQQPQQHPSRDVLQWEEQNRRILAYEIHDGFVQQALAAMMHLEMLLQGGRVPAGYVRDELELSLKLVRKAVAEARQLVCGLRPAVLEELGIVAALKHLIDDQPPGGPSIRFEADVPFERLEPLLESTIYRIVQEALTNVRRHSKSPRAVVRLTQLGDRVSVEIRDWGIGFVPNGDVGKRFGLRGIRERARLLGGRAVIDSTPGLGTRVLVDLPLAGVPRDVATT